MNLRINRKPHLSLSQVVRRSLFVQRKIRMRSRLMVPKKAYSPAERDDPGAHPTPAQNQSITTSRRSPAWWWPVVIIEAQAGSRQLRKFAPSHPEHSEDLARIKLGSSRQSMSFPAIRLPVLPAPSSASRRIKSTSIDVLLLMDEPAFVGLQPARPISPRSSKNLSRRQASSSSNGSPPAPSPTDRVPSAHDSDPETQTGTVEAGKSHTLSATAIARVKPQSEARPCPK